MSRILKIPLILQILPLLLLLCCLPVWTGCGGGGGGGETATTPTTPANNVTLTTATTAYTNGDVNQAIADFNGVLLSSSDPTTQAKAREGLGFSYLRLNDTINGLKNLEQAASLRADSAVTWSGTLLASQGVNELSRVCDKISIALDTSLGFGGGAVPTGVTSAQGNALGALLLTLRGSTADATRISNYRTKAAADVGDTRAAKILEALNLLTR